jgi:hypothetical protein
MIRTSYIIFSILALFTLTASILLTITWISPPVLSPGDVFLTEFSVGRAMEDLEIIAQEPHPMGISSAHAEVRDYLLGEIRALGLEPQVQDTFGLRVVNPGAILGGPVENVLVRLPGIDPEGAILVMSHYDSTPGGPGAVDSGSGVVIILELLRALRAGAPLRQDVIFLFTDGEEPGMIGSHAFVTQHPWFDDVRMVINLEMFWVGPPVLYLTSGGNGPWVQALARSASSTRPAHLSLPFDLFPVGDTDLVSFKLAGVPGAEFNGGGPFTEKHTALDRPELVDPASLQQAGDQILALIRYLGDQPTLETNIPDQTFFPLLGMLVHYPSSLARPFAIVAGLCFLGMTAYGLHKMELTWRGLGLGFLVFLLSLTLSVVVANLIWQVILAFHPEYAYFGTFGFRQKLSDEFLYAIGFLVLAFVITVSSIALAYKKVSPLDLAGGALIIWFPLTFATAILVPATSYLFTWVLLTNSLALLMALTISSRNDAWILSGLGFLVSTILAIFLWIPLFSFAILAGPMSPDTPLLSIMVGLATLWLGSMTPILAWLTYPRRWSLPVAALLIALGFFVAGHFMVGRDSPPPLVNPIGYWLDASEEEAYWVTFSDGLDERQASLLTDSIRRPYTALFSEAPPFFVLTSTAPMLDLDGPHLEVLSDRWEGDHRVVEASVTASMYERILIIIPKESPLLAITVQDSERTTLPPVDDGGWWLRFEGMPAEGIEITFEFSGTGPIQFLLIEESTGLPYFSGLSTQPEPGTMKSPGVFTQAIPTDFTAINRNFVIQEIDR